MVRKCAFIAMSFAILASMPAFAQTPAVLEKSVTRDGFAFPADGPVRIVLFRPEIKIGEQTTAGLLQPNADWSEAARLALTQTLLVARAGQNIDIIPHPDQTGSDAALLADYQSLFRAVAGAAIRHKLMPNDPLPSKSASFDWSLGSGVARLVPAGGADYGLFFFSYDGFESNGRRSARIVASLMGAKGDAGRHFGYAALVDLRNGDLVWLNVDLKAGGDVRTVDGAAQRVANLLAGFPERAKGVK
jgi:hypothetical protein